MFANPTADEIARLLRAARTIAIVGLSPDRTRPSHGVARGLQRFGYRVIPVNPFAESILGEPAVASLEQLPEVLAPGEQVDIVEVFRRPQHVAAIVEQCLRLHVPALWLQDGVIDTPAAWRATQAGLVNVIDRAQRLPLLGTNLIHVQHERRGMIMLEVFALILGHDRRRKWAEPLAMFDASVEHVFHVRQPRMRNDRPIP